MVVLAGASNLVTLFLGIELLSIPLYVMCALDLRRRTSLEAGLKYLVIGSVGSATLLYGLALIYGATGATDFGPIAAAIEHQGILGDPLLLTGIALAATGLAFKASVAPFHQWTPDVYEGAPTPVTAFMAVATKTAAFAIIVRFFDCRAAARRRTTGTRRSRRSRSSSIVIGNVGAIGQDSLKRLLAWSGVAQAGYMLAGVVVATETGREERRLLPVRLPVDEHGRVRGGDRARARDRVRRQHRGGQGIGATRPLLAWPLTISMLGLAGLPGTAGFIGKFFLIEASVDGDFTWLGVVIVIGSMVSLAYYLRVIAAMWMPTCRRAARSLAPVMAGGSPEADALRRSARRRPRSWRSRSLMGAATLVLRDHPGPAARGARARPRRRSAL